MQSRFHSLLEQVLNVGSGFVLSFFIWMLVIVPIFDFETTVTDNLLVTTIFTVVSVIRGYMWRRIFNNFIQKC